MRPEQRVTRVEKVMTPPADTTVEPPTVTRTTDLPEDFEGKFGTVIEFGPSRRGGEPLTLVFGSVEPEWLT